MCGHLSVTTIRIVKNEQHLIISAEIIKEITEEIKEYVFNDD